MSKLEKQVQLTRRQLFKAAPLPDIDITFHPSGKVTLSSPTPKSRKARSKAAKKAKGKR